MVTAVDKHPSDTNDDDSGPAAPAGGPFAAAQFSIESLLESLSEGVVVADSGGKIVLVNRRTEEIFGYRRPELLGQPLAMLLPSRFVASHSRMLNRYFSNPTLRHIGSGFDLVGMRRDGVEIPLEIGLSPLPGIEGPMSLATIVDVSRRMETETALKERNAELDSFTHALAHDLRGALSLVKGFGELLLEDLDELEPDEIRRYLTIMLSNSGRMEAVISGMMLLASIIQKHVELERVTMVKTLRAAAERLSAELDAFAGELDLPESMPDVSGVENWIEEVWVTLLGSAVRRCGPDARVEAGGSPMEDGSASFWVKDSGAAIPRAELKAMFAAADDIKLPESASSGLRLEFIQQMIRKMGGDIWVESGAGQGNTFTFRLPAAAEPDAAAE